MILVPLSPAHWTTAIGNLTSHPAAFIIMIAYGSLWFSFSRESSEIGVAVDVPRDIFTVDAGPTTNAAGRTFNTSDGRADVIIYSMLNGRGGTPASFLRERIQLPDLPRCTDALRHDCWLSQVFVGTRFGILRA